MYHVPHRTRPMPPIKVVGGSASLSLARAIARELGLPFADPSCLKSSESESQLPSGTAAPIVVGTRPHEGHRIAVLRQA